MRVGKRLKAGAQRAHDLVDYLRHRSSMVLAFHYGRWRKRRLLGRTVHSILIVRLASLGDVVRASAVIGSLRQRHPDSRIEFLTTDGTRAIVESHPDLAAVWTLEDLASLAGRRYDWIVNLQASDPPEAFLKGSGLSYGQVLAFLETRVPHTLMSGRQTGPRGDIKPTNIMYCRSEIEELFLTALLPFDPRRYPRTTIHTEPQTIAAFRRKWSIPHDRPVLGLYLGSNSVGCGYDEGFRTYSIDRIENFIHHFAQRFTIVVIGQSQVRNGAERARYEQIVASTPQLVDLVDKTPLVDLLAVMEDIDVLVACDSGPIHIAMARGVPVVGLYANNATFAMSPALEGEHYIAFNSAPPCFRYSWRWKYFCPTCRDERTRAAYCTNTTFRFAVDRIPLTAIDSAVERMLLHGRRQATQGPC